MYKFNLGGAEIGLAYTVRAQMELAKLNGNKSINQFFDTFSNTEDDEKNINTIIDALKILHDAYERAAEMEAKQEGRIFQKVEIDEDVLLDLPLSEWNNIENAIVEVIRKDSGISVETAPAKGKGKKTAKES